MSTPLSRQMDQMADAQEWRERAQAAEVEVERLREVVAGELAYRHTVEAQVVELSAQANQLEREAGAAQDENQRLRVDVDHELGLRWLAQMSASEAYAKRDCLLSDLRVLRAKLDDWAAQRDYVERAEQAEGQCEAVSKECIRLQEKLAEAEAARKEMFEAAEQYRIDWKRAEAEIERLREQSCRWYRADGGFDVLAPEEVTERRKRAAVEIERLREALSEIVVLDSQPPSEVLRIARAALEPKP